MDPEQDQDRTKRGMQRRRTPDDQHGTPRTFLRTSTKTALSRGLEPSEAKECGRRCFRGETREVAARRLHTRRPHTLHDAVGTLYCRARRG